MRAGPVEYAVMDAGWLRSPEGPGLNVYSIHKTLLQAVRYARRRGPWAHVYRVPKGSEEAGRCSRALRRSMEEERQIRRDQREADTWKDVAGWGPLPRRRIPRPGP